MSAVTDLECEVKYDKVKKPGISNLLTIYSCLKDITIEEAEKEFIGANYGTFKKAVADIVCETLEKLQSKYNEYINSDYLDQVLEKGAKEAASIAKDTIKRVKACVGLYAKK